MGIYVYMRIQDFQKEVYFIKVEIVNEDYKVLLYDKVNLVELVDNNSIEVKRIHKGFKILLSKIYILGVYFSFI